jgi:hypothetical protein
MAEKLYQKALEPKRLWIMAGGHHYNPPGKRHAHYERRIAGYFQYIFTQASGQKISLPEDEHPGGVSHD